MNRKAKQWEDKLNSNKAGAQNNAEDFTKQFMQDMYSESSMTNIETRQQSLRTEETQMTKGTLRNDNFRHFLILLLFIFVLKLGIVSFLMCHFRKR